MADPAAERELEARWRALVDISLAQLPEIADEIETATTRTPGMVWTTVVLRGLDTEGAPVPGRADFWARVLQVVEVVEEAMALIPDNPAADDDATELRAFSTAGILCDVTRTPRGLEHVVPFMGPLSVAACREEIETHKASRGFDSSAVDWSAAGTRFHPLSVEPSSILPEINER